MKEKMKLIKGRFLRPVTRTGFLAAVLITGLLSAPYASAKDEKTLESEFELEAMTVTAQKQEENVQEVPVSMTVLSGNHIEDKNIDGLWDLMDHVPGLMNFDTGMSDMFSQPSMRGITAPSNTFNSSVGLYIDGVPILASPGFTAGLLDIERVEVLRGPQGTLYGKNSEAGVINIITRRPDNDMYGKVQISAGEDNKRLMTGSVSGPIAKDKLFFSLVGQYDEKDGFLENKNLGGHDDDRKRYYGRTQLRWTPSEKLDISLIASRLAADEGLSAQTPNAAMMARNGLSPLPEKTTYSDLRPYNDTYNDIQSLKITYDISDSMSLTSITARKVTDWESAGDFDFTDSHIYHIYTDSQYSNLSQEIRFNWKSDRIKSIVGLYADEHMNDHLQGTIMTDDSKVPTTKRELGGDSYAVFGQIDYSLTQAIHVVTGLRYEMQNMDYDDDILNIDDEESWSKVTPKLSLQYRFSPHHNVYATVAEGYRTGGFNNTAVDLDYRTFEPETLWNYEIGIKASFLDNRIIVNASVYYMDISDMQVEEYVTPVTTYITNAAKATSKGGEIEISARLVKGLDLTAGFAYIDTTFDTFKDANGDYSGNKNPFAPEYTFNLGAIYRHSSGVYISSDLLGYGDTYIDKENNNKRDAYMTFNAKIGYEREKFDIYLYAENLFDKEYNAMNYYNYYNNYSPPREIGVQLAYRF